MPRAELRRERRPVKTELAGKNSTWQSEGGRRLESDAEGVRYTIELFWMLTGAFKTGTVPPDKARRRLASDDEEDRKQATGKPTGDTEGFSRFQRFSRREEIRAKDTSQRELERRGKN